MGKVVLIDYNMYQELMAGVNPDITNEIVRQIKEGTLFFTTVQGQQLSMSVDIDGDLIVNEKLIFQIISLSSANINVEKMELYKNKITNSLSKYITVLNG